MDVKTIVPGHGPLGGKRELPEMSEYLALFKTEAWKRYNAGLTPGKAAADIKLGKFDSWIGARPPSHEHGTVVLRILQHAQTRVRR